MNTRGTRQSRRQARLLFQLCLVDGLLDETRAMQIVQRVIQAKPRGYRAALAHLERLLKLDYARRAASIESVAPLPSEMSTRVQAKLVQSYGRGLNITFAQNPELIGGMRITVGSDVYDGSIQARLTSLHDRFEKGEAGNDPLQRPRVE